MMEEQMIIKQAFIRTKQVHIQQKKLSNQTISQLSEKLTETIQKIILINTSLSHIGTNYLSQSSTKNLRVLFLNNNKIGNKGCKYLTQAHWNNLQYLCLNQNRFDSVGVSHLSKGNWGQLKALQAMGNHLNNGAVKMINRTRCPKLSDLSLTNIFMRALVLQQNYLTSNEVKSLLLCQWKNVKYICLNDYINSYQKQLTLLKSLLKLKFSTDSIFIR